MRHIVKASRLASSIFGAACAPLKDEMGKVIRHPTLLDAQKEAERLNKQAGTANANVHYIGITEE
jgi:hypothetical protein